MMVRVMSPSSRGVHKLRDGSVVNRRIGKETADVRVRAPQMMADHLAAAEVVNLKPQVTISLVGLE